ncbi:FtsK/SpoIIIE family DNA translocase [Alkalicoccobacillus murimartini]|uniref:S-DNA-T family DNA segregation ATPase FtsK/SpoIIIE n=2 Tax=Bacillaceae TaxID=186817 RepID=A0ABT9YEK9_9BACI|nr:DNA translocase FtsK [Alkalicoccobacillus murimartini]MDQ0206284.1 S-DNA-T family DNA segregation ATPase FtsK/SpoIIIE [Alkalicoccobacillus murimartini]
MARRKKRKKTNWKSQLTYEIVGLGLLVMAVVTLARLGGVGEAFVRLFRFFLGEWFFLLAIGLLVISLYIMFKRTKPTFWSRRMAGFYIVVLSLALLGHWSLFRTLGAGEGFADTSVIRNTWDLFWLEASGNSSGGELGGGMIGAVAFAVSHFLFASGGTIFLCIVLMVIGVILITGRSVSEMLGKGFRRTYLGFVDFITSLFKESLQWSKQSREKMKEERTLREEKKTEQKNKEKSKPTRTDRVPSSVPEETYSEEIPEIVDFSQNAYQDNHVNEPTATVQNEVNKSKDKEPANEETVVDDTLVTTSLVTAGETNESYILPSFELLKAASTPGQHQEKQQLTSNARKLEQTLDSFGVKARVTKVHLGPAVTKYEVNPNIGVKVSKIVNLADDLALALAAKDIRIEAPIPGKSAIGIEVPNKEVAIVSLREVLDSAPSKAEEHVLAVGLGRDISGEPVLAPLNKMPHLLVAGATGSGKSVCINGIITSILMKAKPHEVKLMMIDPKMVELNVYNGIPHLLTPVVTEPKKASQALKKVVAEMERRYDLFSHSGTRNLEGYNELIRKQNEAGDAKQPFLPYIVVIVDELADLMMVASGDVEDSIARLAQMARASGIHMIIATQRPSVDVITGVIKANIPSRIAFGVSSQTDSRTILDSGGAEKLLGRGDMLYLPVGANKPTRIQGAFLSDEEVEDIVSFVISQQKAQYQEEMTPTEEVEAPKQEVQDELYSSAVDLVVEMNTASVSMLQRRFRIGYTRAARLIDEMELRGVVGKYEGSKPREVLISANPEDEASSS